MRFLFFLTLPLLLSGQGYKPGDFQKNNPNYKSRNPFYFEGRIDWDLLKIDQPGNAWEFVQRGIHRQDDLEDLAGAILDYRQALSLNSLGNKTCQLVTAAPTGFGQSFDPPPCMFTPRLRLANLIRKTQPEEAINLLNEVLSIDPLRLGVSALIGEIYASMAGAADGDTYLYAQAIAAYESELALSPVTDTTRKLTGDDANNAHTHWALAEIYRAVGQRDSEAAELSLYLKATKWHSDTYPWRIQLAQKRLAKMSQ